MIISALNALTLSPALCAVFLRAHHGPKRGILGYVLRGIDKARDGYSFVVRKIVRFAAFGVVVLLLVMAGAGWLFKVTPTGFLPSEDQGAVFAEVQLPEGASVNRTEAVVKRVEEIVDKHARRRQRDVGGRLQPDRQPDEVEQRADDRTAQAVRRAQGARTRRQRHHRSD